MKRLSFLSCVLASFFCFSAYAQSPNILLIIADDMGIDAINGYHVGSIHPTTPHLDSLRNSGVNFTNAWSSPVCTPTRAGIMSGKYGSKTGVKTVPGNLDTTHVSIFKSLKSANANYSAAVIGKWHVARPADPMHPVYHGTDHYTGVLQAGVADYASWDKTENGVTSLSTDYITSYLTDDAINWIDGQNNPWFLWLAHVAPHSPLHVPPAFMHSQPSTNSQLKKYMAMIESLDYEVGRLLDSLSPADKANTTIIFIGDNGTSNNVLQDYPANRGKETLYAGGIHVPMFVCGKGVTRVGDNENALVNVVDIYATVTELAGANLPGGIYNSLSFKHLLSSSSLPKRRYNFSELDTNNSNVTVQGYAIRNSVYKLIEYYTGAQEMFNLVVDTFETNNLLLGTLTVQEQAIKMDLENEAAIRRTAWSCKDGILNGDEIAIDSGGTQCQIAATAESRWGKDFRIYPNPAKDVLIIEAGKPFEMTISNHSGQVMQSLKVSSSVARVSLEGYAAGLYFVRCVSRTNRFVKKVVIH